MHPFDLDPLCQNHLEILLSMYVANSLLEGGAGSRRTSVSEAKTSTSLSGGIKEASDIMAALTSWNQSLTARS